MVQALINTLNNLQHTQKPNNVLENFDFQSLYEKQAELLENTDSGLLSSINPAGLELLSDIFDEREQDILPAEEILSEIQAKQGEIISCIMQNMIPEANLQNEDTETEELFGDIQDVTVSENSVNLNFDVQEPNLQQVCQAIVKPAEKEAQSIKSGKKLDEIVDKDILEELNIESLETEAFDSEMTSGEEFMQNQTPQEQGLKAILQQNTISETERSTETFEVKQASNLQSSVQNSSERIIEQVTKQMEGLKNSSRVNMVLNPESLGKVSIQLINTKEGLSAQFTVATTEAREILMKGLEGLKETLVSQGVNVDNVSVKMNETQESKYNPDWTEQEGSNGGNKEQNSKQKKPRQEQFEQAMAFIEDENKDI